MSLPSTQAQVVFSAPTLPPDSVRAPPEPNQTSFRVSYFDSTARRGKQSVRNEHLMAFTRDSLLARLADSAFTGEISTKPSVDYRTHRLKYIPAIPPVRLLSWQQYRVSSRFGRRIHPISGNAHLHSGLDLPQPMGTPVYATADGVVKWIIRKNDGLGLAVCVKHPTGYESIYGHLLSCTVRIGDNVQQGTFIGRVGSTGRSTGPHLHYAILYQGKPVNPEHYCFLWMKLARAELKGSQRQESANL